MSADARLDALQELLDEFSSRLADFLARAEKREEEHDGAAESTATALGDILKALSNRKPLNLDPLVQALQQLRVEPHIHVQPAPVVVQPAAAEDATWEVRVQGQNGAPDRLMTITKTTRR